MHGSWGWWTVACQMDIKFKMHLKLLQAWFWSNKFQITYFSLGVASLSPDLNGWLSFQEAYFHPNFASWIQIPFCRQIKLRHLGGQRLAVLICSKFLVLEADSKKWNNDRQKWLSLMELKEFSPGWSAVLQKWLSHTFAGEEILENSVPHQTSSNHIVHKSTRDPQHAPYPDLAAPRW